jgi:hypothetical protein
MWRDGYAFDATAMNVRPVHTTNCTSINQSINQSISQSSKQLASAFQQGQPSTEDRAAAPSRSAVCIVSTVTVECPVIYTAQTHSDRVFAAFPTKRTATATAVIRTVVTTGNEKPLAWPGILNAVDRQPCHTTAIAGQNSSQQNTCVSQCFAAVQTTDNQRKRTCNSREPDRNSTG